MDSEPSEILRHVEGDVLDPRGLTGLGFQDIVFTRMKDALLKRVIETYDLPDSSILSNHETGEVDFVLRHIDPVTGDEIGHHLFECKNYKRTLELSATAKLFLIGLRRLPTSLNLVSATALQRQAADYARFFFLEDSDPGRQTDKPGGATVFRHWVTHDLVKFDERGYETRPGQEAAPIASWEIARLHAFYERTVATSVKKSAAVVVYAGTFYRIDVVIEYSTTIEHAAFGFLSSMPAGVSLCGDLQCDIDRSLRAVRLSALLRFGPAAAGCKIIIPPLGRYGDDPPFGVRLPQLSVEDEPSIDIDMRPKDTAAFSRTFSGTNDWRLILFTGEAGTGKTWICEAFAEERRAYDSWDILQFDIPKHADRDLLREMAVKLLLPPRLRTDDQHSDIERSATELVQILAPTANDPNSDYGDRTPVVLSEFVAQALTQLGPRLIIIRNCEQLTDAAARDIGQLIHAVKLRGWGDVRIILEGRADEKHARAWRTLLIDLSVVDRAVRYHLEPMDRESVYKFLSKRFSAIVPELKELCYDRAGGYPLLLRGLLDWLAASGAIDRRSERWRIVPSPTEFRRGLTQQHIRYSSQTRSDEILIRRLRSIEFGELAADVKPPLNDPLLLLGLFALAETPDRISLLAEMLGLGDVAIRLSDVLKAEGLHDTASSDAGLRFRHDRYREAAVTLARDSPDAALQGLLDILPSGNRIHRTAVELLGDLLNLIGQHDRAWTHYQRASKAAEEADAYLDVSRLAVKREELFAVGRSRQPMRFGAYLQMLVSRAWAEWNCGSMRASRDTYLRVVEEATTGSDVFMHATSAQAYIAHASWRLVGINLELVDSAAFTESAILALNSGQDVGDYNAVMNRLVLYCGRFGLPELGVSFVPLSLAQTSVDAASARPESKEDGAVICADVGRLYLDTLPELALDIFRTGQKRSTRRRQQLWSTIDVLVADYLVRGTLDGARADELRDEALRMGLFAFLVRIDLLRCVEAIRNHNLGEAERLLGRARERIDVQSQPCYSTALANNALVSALMSGNAALAAERASELVRCVQDGLDGRDQALPRIEGTIRDLVMSRWRRYQASPLTVRVHEQAPALCSSLLRSWFNLRTLATDDGDIALLARTVAGRVVPALDLVSAEEAFARDARARGATVGDLALALCVE